MIPTHVGMDRCTACDLRDSHQMLPTHVGMDRAARAGPPVRPVSPTHVGMDRRAAAAGGRH